MPRPIAPHRQPGPAGRLVNNVVAEQLAHNLDGWAGRSDSERDAVQAANRIFRADAVPNPRRARVAIAADDLEPEPRRVGHMNALFTETRGRIPPRDAAF